MSTACQSCDTLGQLPAPPTYPGCPPAPPAQGCSAVWGSITGDIGNQTDLAAYVGEQTLANTAFFRTLSDIEYPPSTPLTVVPAFNTTLAANTTYEVEVNLQTGWEEPSGSSVLEADMVLPAGSTLVGTWMYANEVGVYASSMDVGAAPLGAIRFANTDSPNIPVSHPSKFLITTTFSDAFSVRLRTNPGTTFILYAGSWMTIKKLN